MIKILEGASENTIALDIIDGYEFADEQAIEKMFDKKIAANITRINFLIKTDQISLTHSSWKAMWKDGLFAMKHIKKCGHIAIVGNSKLEEILVKTDNVFFQNKKSDRMERYFDIADLDKAMGWANE